MQFGCAPAKVLVVIGTRPEAIKLFPVIRELGRHPALTVVTCVTGQHGDLVDGILTLAGIVPDIDLAVMRPGQSLDALTAGLILALGATIDTVQPDMVVVQGDTVSALAAAFVASTRRIPVAHVEAGLRSGNLHDPCPEEGNRRMIGTLATLHFAPTPAAAAALRREGVTAHLYMTGNTVIDALTSTQHHLSIHPGITAELDRIIAGFGDRRLILATVHRRESRPALAGIANAFARIADRGDAAILLPLHPNPLVEGALRKRLAGHPAIALTPPLDYPNAIRALAACHIVLTDSGGLQEEAPFFGKPVLVMRETTERPEGIAAGTARLVGVQEEDIIAAAADLLDHPSRWTAMAKPHLSYGTGTASGQIALSIAAHLRPAGSTT